MIGFVVQRENKHRGSDGSDMWGESEGVGSALGLNQVQERKHPILSLMTRALLLVFLRTRS